MIIHLFYYFKIIEFTEININVNIEANVVLIGIYQFKIFKHHSKHQLAGDYESKYESSWAKSKN